MIYKTAEIAKLIGVHPNTVRFYEEMGLLPTVPRNEKGYRIFNHIHLKQLRLLRTAFRAEIISSKLRQEAIGIIKRAAQGDCDGAYLDTEKYLEHLKEEKEKAEEAIRITISIVENTNTWDDKPVFYGRKEMAGILGITIDVLRDWERNGLIQVPHDKKGYRQYGLKEINRLKIIRILRNANYSIMSILRMLKGLDSGQMNLKEFIDTPAADEDIVCATDRYITALNMAQNDAVEMMNIIKSI
ncbi:UNVERIFIED_CONTAM: DNA-binding transcriptional MerR regulator [Acetivibrio alkalicellulosi]